MLQEIARVLRKFDYVFTIKNNNVVTAQCLSKAISVAHPFIMMVEPLVIPFSVLIVLWFQAVRHHRYRIIGHGSFCEAVLDTHTKTVIKKPHTPYDVEHLLREMNMIRQALKKGVFDHPHIGTPDINSFKSADKAEVQYSMPYLGVPLSKYRTQNPHLTAEQKWQLIAQVYDATMHMHSCGFVHCDLRLDNIVVQGEVAHVIDFGSMCTVVELKKHKLDSNPFYTSSSLAKLDDNTERHKIQTKENVDVYAIATVAYKLFVGHYPKTPDQTKERTLTDLRLFAHHILVQELEDNGCHNSSWREWIVNTLEEKSTCAFPKDETKTTITPTATSPKSVTQTIM